MALSKNTSRDIRAIHPHIDGGKAVVAPAGVDRFFFAASPKREPYARPYFLYVGDRSGNKSFSTLLSPFRQPGLAPGFDLWVISRDHRLDSDEINWMSRYKMKTSVKFWASGSEVDLCEAYAGAVVLTYPSVYEGFGLPILEAMASSTLAAASNASSMPEVDGDAAFYFDPNHPESIAECLRQIACPPTEQRCEHIRQGQAWARVFTWERCQQLTVNAIQYLL